MALFAGSFDPVHLGHLSVIEQAAAAFDEVVVAVLANPDKASGLFAPAERVRLLVGAVVGLDRVRVEQFHGLTVDLARRTGAGVLVRAAHKEYAVERSLASANHLLAGIPTVFVGADPATGSISSTLVRNLLDTGRLARAQELVPPNVARALAELSAG